MRLILISIIFSSCVNLSKYRKKSRDGAFPNLMNTLGWKVDISKIATNKKGVVVHYIYPDETISRNCPQGSGLVKAYIKMKDGGKVYFLCSTVTRQNGCTNTKSSKSVKNFRCNREKSFVKRFLDKKDWKYANVR